MDDDGYPDDEELKRITEWPWKDAIAMIEFVVGLWWCAEMLHDEVGDTLHLSTGGWSGNESLISAMQRNGAFWHAAWESSRRGGHYTFDLSRWTRLEKTG